jgi:YhcH/YjgK/YiaL family protein
VIFDKIENAKFYYGLDEKIKISLNYLQQNDLEKAENGKYEIDGENIFVIVHDYDTKSPGLGRWEAHRDYIDIQFIIKGMEKIGFANIADFSPITNYDREKDIVFLEGEGNFMTLNQGYFAVFTPEDAHMPGIFVKKPEYVKKAVMKIKNCF